MNAPQDHTSDLRELLEGVAGGRIDVEEAQRRLRLFQLAPLGQFARLDTNRDLRKGVPEVVYASRKSDAELEAIARRCLVDRGFALFTRLDSDSAAKLREALAGDGEGGADDFAFAYNERARVLAVHADSYRLPPERGCVGLLTAGTSDIPVAEEAALVITHMGCRVERGYDVGVAGLHRLLEPLTRILENGADALVVVAGMEGALPSVVAGLVDVPVIGVPTSTGYGLGGDGTAALYSILQSCSPGLVAVNIDNGVGAGAAAALVARRHGGASGR
jgi:NCAIR mutase (PurE)-related protein